MVEDKSLWRYTERRDAAENRQRIKSAALKLFEHTAVEQVSMNQIAAEAKVGAGTLYRRYRNKSELCMDLIRDSIARLFSDIDTYLTDHQSESPSDRLKGVLRLFIVFREKKSALLKGVDSSTFTNKAFIGSPLYQKLHPIFATLFQEIMGHSTIDASSTFKADLLFTVFSGSFYALQREVRGNTPEALLDEICKLFVNESLEGSGND